MSSQETFLSSLSQDELFNIAYATAKVLRSNPWYQDIPEAVFNLLSDVDGPFSRISSKLFRKVGINDIRSLQGDVLMSGRKSSSARVLSQLRNFVQHLHLCEAPSINCFIHSDLYLQLIESEGCRNLRTLVMEIHWVDVPLTEILTTHASALEHLKIELRGAAIGSFTFPSTTSLSRLQSLDLKRFAEMHSLLRVLRSCNDTLTSLCLEDVKSAPNATRITQWNLIINFLRNHCSGLQELSLVGESINVNEYSNLLMNYGSRLTRSNTSCLNAHPNLYAQVLFHCSNLQCDMNNPPECLLGMHHVALRTNKLCFSFHHTNLKSWQQFLDQCHSITDVQIVSYLADVTILPIFFRVPKMRLRKVSLFLRNLVITTNVLRTVMNHTPELQELQLWVANFQDHVATVHVLRSAEAKNLTRVRLWLNDLVTQSYALDFCFNVLRAFRSCAHLKELSITMEMEQTEPRKFKDAIHAECQFLRFRQAKIVVCGTVYFDEEGYRRL